MAISRSKREARIEAGSWRSWGDYWRAKTAEQNIDTRSWQVEDALQVAPFTAAVLVLAKTLAASDWIVERMRSDGMWERVLKGLPAWLDPGKRPNRWQSAQDFRKMVSLNLNIYGNALVVAQEKQGWQGWPNRMVAYPWTSAEVYVDGHLAEVGKGDSLGLPGYGSLPQQVLYVLDGADGYRPLSAFEPDGDVVHIRYATLTDTIFGYSPLSWAAPAVTDGDSGGRLQRSWVSSTE